MPDSGKGGAYTVLSKYYEYLNADEEYRKWAESVVETVKKYSPSNIGADVACGTGYFTRALKRNGFDVTGYDISSDMLSEAVTLALKEGLKPDFLLGNLKNFKSLKKLGFVTVINDGFNYLKPEELKKAFKNMYSQLAHGGVLIFDISSEYKIKKVLSNNVFSVDEDDFTYVWFNEQFSGGVKMDITVFSKKGELYEKSEETHVQYIHTLESVTEKLKEVGFSLEKTCGINGEGLNETSERICFVAIKR